MKEAIKMQLSATTDYAIRIILYLLKHNQIVRSVELSEELNIPKTYVLKVTKKMANAGIVKCYQGVNGGIKLVEKTNEITLWDVIDVTENTTMINKCLEKNGFCYGKRAEDCPVRKVYVFLQKAMQERLQSIKLSDLLENTDYHLSKELKIDQQKDF